jgi:hypothetical protein
MLDLMRSLIVSIHGRRSFAFGLTALLLASVSLGARRQEPSLRAERVVDFALDKPAPLNARVGPVNVQSVQFSDRGRPTGPSLASRIAGASGSDPEMTTVIRSHFQVENPTADEWEVTFTIEFLDRSGKVIDRVTRKSSWEGRAKPLDVDHSLLTYVVPAIAQVRIKLEARLD